MVLIAAGTLACRRSTVTPSPQYPNMTGAWNGTLTITSDSGFPPNVCTHAWNVTSQNGGSISGTSLSSGSCRVTGGSVSGTISTDGTLTLGPNILALDNDCQRLSGTGYSGTVSGSSLTAQMAETFRCTPAGQAAFALGRSLVLALQK